MEVGVQVQGGGGYAEVGHDLLPQVSISGQALVFVVRTSSWSLMSRAGMLTYVAFFMAQVGALKHHPCITQS